MKFALACLMLSVIALVVSARNEHHCKKSDAEMKKLIACVIAKIPDASSEGAFKKYITAAQLELLHGLVDSCSH